MCVVSKRPRPRVHRYAPDKKRRVVSARKAGCKKNITTEQPESRMRFHPKSVFGKAWYAHYAAAGLAHKTYDEQHEEYNRFCLEWQARDWQSPPATGRT